MFGGEVRMERDVEQPGESAHVHRRQAGDRRRIEHAVADDAKPAGPLGDEHVAVRQPRHAPRMRQLAASTIDDADLVLFGGVEDDRAGRQRHGGDADRQPAAAAALLGGSRTTSTGKHEQQ